MVPRLSRPIAIVAGRLAITLATGPAFGPSISIWALWSRTCSASVRAGELPLASQPQANFSLAAVRRRLVTSSCACRLCAAARTKALGLGRLLHNPQSPRRRTHLPRQDCGRLGPMPAYAPKFPQSGSQRNPRPIRRTTRAGGGIRLKDCDWRRGCLPCSCANILIMLGCYQDVWLNPPIHSPNNFGKPSDFGGRGRWISTP